MQDVIIPWHFIWCYSQA